MSTNHKPTFKFILLVVLLALTFSFWLNVARAPQVLAQGISIPCVPPAKSPTLTVKLADAIAENVGGKATNARGTFFQNKVTVDLVGNDAVVCLASSAALAPLQVDDQLELLVGDDKARSESWVYDFYDQKTKGITELPAQNISRLFAHGANVLRLELRDFKPDVYSTRQVWLVIWQGTPPTATPAPRATATALPPSITLGAEKIDLGRIESLADSPHIVIPVSSTSAQAETLSLTVANVPGVAVTPAKIEIAPRANTNVTVRLSASSDLPPQVYVGAIVLSASSATQLPRSQIPFRFEIVAPQIRIEPAQINLGNVERLGPATVVTLNLASTDSRDTVLRFTVDSSEVQIVSVEPPTLAANEARAVRVHLASSAIWSAGDHTVALKLEAPRPAVTVAPEKIVVQFRVPSLIERIAPWALGTLLLSALAAGIWFTVPAPSGRLVGIAAPTGQPPTFELARYISPLQGFSKRVTLGSARDNAIRLDHPSVVSHHAVIVAQRRRTVQRTESATGSRTALSRRTVAVLTQVAKTAPVSVNGAAVPATGHILEWHDRIRIGDYEFEYR